MCVYVCVDVYTCTYTKAALITYIDSIRIICCPHFFTVSDFTWNVDSDNTEKHSEYNNLIRGY